MVRYYFSMLHLVSQRVDAAASDDPFSPPVHRRHAPGRSWDIAAPWYLRTTSALRRLASQADEFPLHLGTALALVLERELLRIELAATGQAIDVISRLDDAAANHGGVSRALPGADAVYLRSLTSGAAVETPVVVPHEDAEVCISLPARLSARLLAAGGPQQIAVRDELPAAIHMEIAAVCAGQTMSEWAAWTLLSR
jgi:hypothetical protein